MIEKLALNNFTLFEDFAIDFDKRINVLIGANGTGKTHVLKAAYAMCCGNNSFMDGETVANDDIEKELTQTFVRLFLPLDDKLGKLRRHGAAENASVCAKFVFDKELEITFHTNSKNVAVQRNTDYERYSWRPTYIPTKEVLSFMKGFNSLYEKYGLSFDQTYHDIILALELPELRAELLEEKARWVMDEIEQICGGKFVFYGAGKVTFKTANAEFSANAMAEGFRKAGMLSRLLETGAIRPGVSGPLFWDEPESNLNPTLSRFLVEVLLELARNGQQIILATHDYVLLKWFDILCDEAKEERVIYHALYRNAEGRIDVESAESYLAVAPNVIADSFEELYDAEVKRSFGGKE